MRFAAHTRFATVGLLVGREGCAAPTLGLDWIPTLPPVVLTEWPVAEDGPRKSFTTVANWRSYGTIEHDGRLYGQKAHSFRELAALPRRTGARFEVALAIDPGDSADEVALRANGWSLLDPGETVGTPDLYAEFIRGSLAEIGVAKSGYALGRSGWFSDRSACYLASGKPVLAQDTGFAGHVPVGEGLLSFASLDDAGAGVERIVADYRRHAAAARELAATHFAAESVLGVLLDRIFDGRND